MISGNPGILVLSGLQEPVEPNHKEQEGFLNLYFMLRGDKKMFSNFKILHSVWSRLSLLFPKHRAKAVILTYFDLM